MNCALWQRMRNGRSNFYSAITAISVQKGSPAKSVVDFQQRFSKQAYTDIIEKLRGHILRGDCYEVNFCQEFFAENTRIDPVQAYQLLAFHIACTLCCFL